MFDFAVKDSGLFKYSKWLTCANRVLRYYISKMNTSYEFKVMIRYIMRMHALVWFDIKRNYSVMYGQTNVLKYSYLKLFRRHNSCPTIYGK